MVKKNKRIGGRELYLEQQAALLPLRFTFVPFGTGHAGSDVIGSPERPVLMEYVDDEATQKRFYEALLKLPWLAPEVRNGIIRELGRSPREVLLCALRRVALHHTPFAAAGRSTNTTQS